MRFYIRKGVFIPFNAACISKACKSGEQSPHFAKQTEWSSLLAKMEKMVIIKLEKMTSPSSLTSFFGGRRLFGDCNLVDLVIFSTTKSRQFTPDKPVHEK